MGRLAVLVLFVVVPLAELWLMLAVVAPTIGAPGAVALVLASGLLGGVLVRIAGARALREIQGALRAGRVPGREMLSAALVVLGGALLVTPGLLTDVVGLLLLFSPTRALAARLVERHLAGRVSLTASIGGPLGGPLLPLDPFGTGGMKHVDLKDLDKEARGRNGKGGH